MKRLAFVLLLPLLLASCATEENAAEKAAIQTMRMIVLDGDLDGFLSVALESLGVTSDNPMAPKIKMAAKEQFSKEGSVWTRCPKNSPAVDLFASPNYDTVINGNTARVKLAYKCANGDIYESQEIVLRKRDEKWKVDFNE